MRPTAGIAAVALFAAAVATMVIAADRDRDHDCRLPLRYGSKTDLRSEVAALHDVVDAFAGSAARMPEDPHRARPSQTDLLPKALRARYYCEAILTGEVAGRHHLPWRDVAAMFGPPDPHLLAMFGITPDPADRHAAARAQIVLRPGSSR